MSAYLPRPAKQWIPILPGPPSFPSVCCSTFSLISAWGSEEKFLVTCRSAQASSSAGRGWSPEFTRLTVLSGFLSYCCWARNSAGPPNYSLTSWSHCLMAALGGLEPSANSISMIWMPASLIIRSSYVFSHVRTSLSHRWCFKSYSDKIN